MSMALYKIDDAIRSVAQLVEDGEIEAADAADTLESLNLERDAKLESVGCWLKELDAEATALDAEIRSLKSRRDAKQKCAERVSEFLVRALSDRGRFESPRIRLALKSTPPAVKIDDDGRFREWARENAPALLRTKVSEEPDRTAIKDYIRNGNTITGVSLAGGVRLEVK